jgi:hypothetical protein
MMLVNPLHHNLCAADKRENWPADSDLTLLQIAEIIYKIYSPPIGDNKGIDQMAREHQFSYAISNQTIEIQCILSYQEIIDRHYMGQEITPEQNDVLAKIFYKKIPANCELGKDFKARTKADLEAKGTKLDTVKAACYRLRALLADFRELYIFITGIHQRPIRNWIRNCLHGIVIYRSSSISNRIFYTSYII